MPTPTIFEGINPRGTQTFIPCKDVSAFPRSEQAVLGAKNLFNYDVWKNVDINKGTGVFENNGVTLTATDNDCWTRFNVSEYPIGARIPVSQGQKIKLVWNSDTSDEKGNVYIFPNGLVTGSKYVKNNVEELDYTVPADVSFLTVRFGVTTSGDTISYSNIMVLLQSETDLTYAPFAMTNRELTPKHLEHTETTSASGNMALPSSLDGKTILNVCVKSSSPEQYGCICLPYYNPLTNHWGVHVLDYTGVNKASTSVTVDVTYI